MGDYRKLDAWRVADEVALQVYAVTRRFPADERFGLTSQIRRAAVSIPSNIAEGCGRNSPGDLRRFIQVALGSANELEYQLTVAVRLGYADAATIQAMTANIVRVRQMLGRFLTSIRREA